VQATVNKKGLLFGEGPHLKDEESAIELAQMPAVAVNPSAQSNEQYSLVPNDFV